MRKFAVLAVVLILALTGCETLNKWTSKEPAPSAAPKGEALNQQFYGFPDVPLPKELTVVRERSFVYETPTLRVGVLVLNGNVDLESLETYFKVNMVKNGWKFVNSFKFRGTTLNFTKEDKTCNVKMSRDGFSADVEVWVGPADKNVSPRGDGPR